MSLNPFRVSTATRQSAKSTILGLYSRHQTDAEKVVEASESVRKQAQQQSRSHTPPLTLVDQSGNTYINQRGTALIRELARRASRP